MGAFVAKPDERSPAIVVGVEYPPGFEIVCVTFAYAPPLPLLMHDTPEPYALSHFTTALSVFDHMFTLFRLMPVQGAPSAQMSWIGGRATPSLTLPSQFFMSPGAG